jgi:hypothetical protein
MDSDGQRSTRNEVSGWIYRAREEVQEGETASSGSKTQSWPLSACILRFTSNYDHPMKQSFRLRSSAHLVSHLYLNPGSSARRRSSARCGSKVIQLVANSMPFFSHAL